jgi:hypothetical protein
MQLRIFETTDRQHIGFTFEFDPESPPEYLTMSDGDSFEIVSVKDLGDYYQFFSYNYVVGAIPVG